MRSVFMIVVAVIAVAACDRSPVDVRQDQTPTFAVTDNIDNKCYGQMVGGIASTWPWAHNDKIAFAPPRGAIGLFLEMFGPQLGISTARELQLLFCST